MFSFLLPQSVKFMADGVLYNWSKIKTENKLAQLADIKVSRLTHWISPDLSVVKSNKKQRCLWKILSCSPQLRKAVFNADLKKAISVFNALGERLALIKDNRLIQLYVFARANLEEQFVKRVQERAFIAVRPRDSNIHTIAEHVSSSIDFPESTHSRLAAGIKDVLPGALEEGQFL